jgi:cytidylate kinase
LALPDVIAIDGPAGSGKSTLARRLAAKIGYLFLDTGAMYRAVTLEVLRAGVAPEDEVGVSAIARQIELDVRPPSIEDGRQYDVLANGKDITWEIRTHEVDANVSLVSSYAAVRKAMTSRQRQIGARGKVVMVGRDIGTVVLPKAPMKIYLDASVEERARRRYLEHQARGQPAEYPAILQAMRDRDEFDSTRALAPLRVADDAIILDSTGLDEDRVLERALDLVVARNA